MNVKVARLLPTDKAVMKTGINISKQELTNVRYVFCLYSLFFILLWYEKNSEGIRNLNPTAVFIALNETGILKLNVKYSYIRISDPTNIYITFYLCPQAIRERRDIYNFRCFIMGLYVFNMILRNLTCKMWDNCKLITKFSRTRCKWNLVKNVRSNK